MAIKKGKKRGSNLSAYTNETATSPRSRRTSSSGSWTSSSRRTAKVSSDSVVQLHHRVADLLPHQPLHHLVQTVGEEVVGVHPHIHRAAEWRQRTVGVAVAVERPVTRISPGPHRVV